MIVGRRRMSLADRLAEVKVIRKEARAMKMREKTEKRRLKNLEREAKILNREKMGGAGVRVVFHDIPPPQEIEYGRRKRK